jgi:hypothetical protein
MTKKQSVRKLLSVLLFHPYLPESDVCGVSSGLQILLETAFSSLV